MTIENFNFRNKPNPVKASTYTQCCFAHDQPIDTGGVKTGHRLFPGDDTPRTFIKCNLVNCEPPPGSTLVRCNTSIKTRGVVKSTTTVTIDDESLGVDELVDIMHGRYDAETQTYIYIEDSEVPH